MEQIKKDAIKIVENAIEAVLPEAAVKKALSSQKFYKPITLIAIGKAAWSMANATYSILGNQIKQGIVITKYNHSNGSIGNLKIMEAGHPLLDENSVQATREIIHIVEPLTEEDEVIFLVSGGGSALFEMPLSGITREDILKMTEQLLNCGADIVEINAIRKHLSAVKGGRFAKLCEPAFIHSIVLSDVLGDRLDSIASGPAYPDKSTISDVEEIIKKYNLNVPFHVMKALQIETPKKITNCNTMITGNVRLLCDAAAYSAEKLGYSPIILTTSLDCEAKEAGKFLGSIARSIQEESLPITPPCAVICGGETIVKITGDGKGGRNQELALSGADSIAELKNCILVAVGSDGTDGPTDAAGGWVDGHTKYNLEQKGYHISTILEQNNSYPALDSINQLITTGPTGTNVNDLYFILCK